MKKHSKRPGRRSKTPGISRIDQPDKLNHGWYVRMTRKGKRFAKFFSDKKGGGKAKALILAKSYYAKLTKANPPMTRWEFAQIQRRPNRSGIVGVSKVIKVVNGRPYKFWQAGWTSVDGKVKKAAFAIGKHGDAGAKRLAMKTRKQETNKLRPK